MSVGWMNSRVARAWIVGLVLLAIALPKNFVVWGFLAAIAFLLWPAFWDRRDKRSGQTTITARFFVAALLTAPLLFGAYRTGGVNLGLAQSEAEQVVTASLRDPTSAEFRDVKEGTTATCGEVNGKNAFGAYAGFKKFVYADGEVRFEPEKPIVANVGNQTSHFKAVAEFARRSRRCYD